MSGVAGSPTSPAAPSDRGRWLTVAAWRALLRDRPIIPLVALLALLVLLMAIVKPDIMKPNWVGVTIRAAIPLALLAACQTITFLTGGIDLSVGAVASMSGFLVATLVGDQGLVVAILVALVISAIAGAITGIGVGVFRVHPLIMVQTGAGVPSELRWLGSGIFLEVLPNGLLVFVPIAALVILMLKRTGYGRLLYAIGDNPIASRLAGARSWQVLIVLYMLSAMIAAVAGFILSGATNVASVTLADTSVLPSVAAAVIGGTSIMGGRGGYGGTIVGALILTVLTALLAALGFPEAVRQVLFGVIIVAVAAAYTRVTAES
jgi:ribose transport system permease protein